MNIKSSRFVYSISTLLLTVSWAACTVTTEEFTPADRLALQIAEEGGDICEPFNFEPEASTDNPDLGKATKCGSDSKTVTEYDAPSQPIDTGTKDEEEAKEKCGSWAVDHSTPEPDWHVPTCPLCPEGSSGCAVSNVSADSSDVKIKTKGGNYFCTGMGQIITVFYSCDTCKLDGCDGGEEEESILATGVNAS